MKTGFIGCGNMGGTLAAAAAKAVGGQDILLYDPDSSKTEALRNAYGCVITDLETLAAAGASERGGGTSSAARPACG